MQETVAETYRERELRRQIEKYLLKWGQYDSVQRFVRKYAKLTTRREYLCDLDLYFRWLQSTGLSMNPDELLRDNLRCVYESGATDVQTKRRHTDLLDLYANKYLVERGNRFSSRHRKAAAVKQFYVRNDSPLFGDFSLSDGKAEQALRVPSAEEIRAVLKALPIQQRAPLVLMWQTGTEPAAVLALKWGEVDLAGSCVKLEFTGRKRHKRSYFKLAGRDSITHLKIWRQRWAEDMGREPGPGDLIFNGKTHGPMSPNWLNQCFKEAAKKLHAEGLVSLGEPDSWHLYCLRHSFSTECSHAGVKPEVREFWMGHVSAISWVYQHPELHEDDFVKEYLKVEPFVSVDYTEALAKREAEGKSAELMSLIKDLQGRFDRLAAQQGVSIAPARQQSQEAPTSGQG